MKKVIFNDQMGTRERECYYGVLHEGKVYTPNEAEQSKLAVFRALERKKKGKWSFTIWEVTTKSAKAFAFMRPFEGWPQSLPLCLEAVKASVKSYTNEDLTDAEAEAVFSRFCPNTYRSVKDKDLLESQLI